MRKYTIEVFRLIIFLSCVIGIIFLFASLFDREDGIGMMDNITPISINGTVSVDGSVPLDISHTLWHRYNATSMTVEGYFSQNITNGDSLIIWPRNLRLKLYVNGELKISTGQRDSFPSFIKYAGNSYKIFYIGEISTTDFIRIELEKAYYSCRVNVYDSFFHHIYVGKEGLVFQSILSNEMIHPLIGLALTLIGILVLVCSFLLKAAQFKHMSQIYYLGWFCIVGGICYVYDSAYEFIDLLFPYPVFNTLVDLCCIQVLLFCYLMFILNVLRCSSTKLFTKRVTHIFITVELIPIILQILGIRDLHEIQDEYIFIGVLIMLFGLGAILYELFYLKNKELNKILFATMPLILSLLLKIINIVLEKGVERTYLRVAILVSSLILLLYTFRYVKRTLELVEQEQQIRKDLQNAHVAIMLSQIQPHFLYNALNTLQYICKKDGQLAAEAINHFSRYLRGNMDSLTNDCPIPFEEELAHVRHYLYIEQLRFGERVAVQYDLEVTDFYIPPLTLQPIVENAIRHGITKQAEGGIVKIHTKQLEDTIIIEVIDNGIGFDIDATNNDGKQHIGINNVRKRLQLQCNATLDIISTQGVGTSVTICMKGKGISHNESFNR